MSDENNKLKAAAIILAGGAGTRMGADKQYMRIGSMPMIERTTDIFLKSGLFSTIIVALSPDNVREHENYFRKLGVQVAPAGITRMGSLSNSFKFVPEDVDVVAVHDGARPFVKPELIKNCLKKAAKEKASVPAVPVKDTIKTISDNPEFVGQTLDRKQLMAAQTPQCYRRDLLKEILAAASKKLDYSDESQVLETLGVSPAFVLSDYNNIKITTPEDLTVAQAIVADEEGYSHTAICRSGFGYDIHRLVEGRPLRLAGVKIEHNKGLLGHSDGDAVLHAVCDALLGSIGAGEIGIFFPPTDITIMGISSLEIAAKTMEILEENRAKIVNIDVTIVAEEPKMKPNYKIMRESLASIFKMKLQDVSVKAKSHEGLGEVGQAKALECYATVSVIK